MNKCLIFVTGALLGCIAGFTFAVECHVKICDRYVKNGYMESNGTIYRITPFDKED